jgi:hypothetical protein
MTQKFIVGNTIYTHLENAQKEVDRTNKQFKEFNEFAIKNGLSHKIIKPFEKY